jgi:hypothetical protein
VTSPSSPSRRPAATSRRRAARPCPISLFHGNGLTEDDRQQYVGLCLDLNASEYCGATRGRTFGLALRRRIPEPEISAAPPRGIGGLSAPVLKVQQLDAVVALTFDVDRTWKGRASKQMLLYRPAPDRRVWQVFEMGRRYMVLAHRLTAAERAQFHIDTAPSDALATGLCGDGSRPFAAAEFELRELGPGRPPR